MQSDQQQKSEFLPQKQRKAMKKEARYIIRAESSGKDNKQTVVLYL